MIPAGAIEVQQPANPAESIQDPGPARWHRLLSVDEERELAERIRNGNQVARKQLILANLRLVVRIARRYRSSKLSLEDLVQEGNLGLIRASEDFDPSVHGSRFATYAEVWIRAFIHRSLVANDSLIRIPEHVFLLRKRYRRVLDATSDPGLADGGGSQVEPQSIEGIARKLGISPRRLKPTTLAAIGRETDPAIDHDGETVPLTETVVDTRRPDDEAADHEQRILLDIALRRLNPVEAWVIRERYGLCVLIPDEQSWSSSQPSGARPTDRDGTPIPEPNPAGSRRAYFHRSSNVTAD
jgi:RNA polymerase sigma factor (sigma-70 family)